MGRRLYESETPRPTRSRVKHPTGSIEAPSAALRVSNLLPSTRSAYHVPPTDHRYEPLPVRRVVDSANALVADVWMASGSRQFKTKAASRRARADSAQPDTRTTTATDPPSANATRAPTVVEAVTAERPERVFEPYAHLGFSRASRVIKLRGSAASGGRPGLAWRPRRPPSSSARCQRRSVCGPTAKRSGGSKRLAAASNARPAVVYGGRFPPRLRIANWWRSTTISSSRSPPPRASTRTTQQRSRYSTQISTTRSLNRLDRDHQHAVPTGIEFLYPTRRQRDGGHPIRSSRLPELRHDSPANPSRPNL
jgi:hypothetical protein